MHVHTYQFQNINRTKEQLISEGAFETAQSLVIYHVKKMFYETKLSNTI